MAKTFTGKVVSTGMQNTILVEVSRSVPHPLYKKLLKRSTKFMADTVDKKAEMGDIVKIVETKPISKNKHFVLQSVLSKKEEVK
ncbi:MAG TPA: 30S ribosomal protein S17 [Patescibacteria group bacterium]|nr:30S ribosomal protein S17 [Patescibacteria group bacterium]